jgi:hypothetical protein
MMECWREETMVGMKECLWALRRADLKVGKMGRRMEKLKVGKTVQPMVSLLAELKAVWRVVLKGLKKE